MDNNVFGCGQCNLVIREARPLGTSPEGFVGWGSIYKTIATAHVVLDQDYHFALMAEMKMAGDAEEFAMTADELGGYIQVDIARELLRRTSSFTACPSAP